MGYTRYWNRTDKPITEEFVKKVECIVADAKKKGITICGWDGNGEPVITLNEIVFNGKAPYMDHETFVITNDERDIGFGFCKTARKPYDYVVRRVLTVAKQMGIVDSTSSDGKNTMITDEEYMKVVE